MHLLVDGIGWVGMATVLLAYGLASAGKMSARKMPFQLMNAASGVCLTINAVYYGTMPIAAMELIWTGIAVVMLYNIFRCKKHGDQEQN